MLHVAESPFDRKEKRGSEKKTGGIQAGQAHTVGWSAGLNGLKRCRTGAGTECFSVAEETAHAVPKRQRQKQLDDAYKAVTKKIPDQKSNDPWATIRPARPTTTPIQR